MRLLLSTLCILTFHFTYSQKEINNTKTGAHKQINGTKYFIIPPPNFTEATSFQGYQQTSTGSSVNVNEITGPYNETSKGFSEEALRGQGLALLGERESVNMNGYHGFFLTTEMHAKSGVFTKYILTFGDEMSLSVVYGLCPKGNKELENAIYNSMFSIIYDKTTTVDPFSSISFTVDTENTKLIYDKILSGMLVYCVKPISPTQPSPDKTSLMVGQYISDSPPADKRQTTIDQVKRLSVLYTDIKIDDKNVNPVTINGISGYEVIGEGTTRRNTIELIYQVTLFNGNTYFILQGKAKDNLDENRDLFRLISKTLKKK